MNSFPGGLSPFRTGYLKVSLFINGAWVNVPTTELSDAGVSIERRTSVPSSLTFALKDPTGKWSPRHPGSPYYGLIGRGTPVRVQVEMTPGQVRDRYYGEVVTWQPRWTLTGAQDAYVDVECAGALRRLGQGQSPLRSVLYRALSSIGNNLVGYWPMEDGSDAKSYGVTVGTKPMTVAGVATPAAYDRFASSEPIPTVGDARLTAIVPAYTALSPAKAQVRWVGRIPAGTPDQAVILRVRATGTLGYVDVRYIAGGAIGIDGFNDSGVSVGSTTYGFAVDNVALRYSLEMTQSGSNISWTFGTLAPGAAGGGFGNDTFTGVTIGSVSSVEFNPNRVALGDVAVGHLTVERDVTSLFAVSSQVLAGYAGERADTRIARLCAENGVSFAPFSTTGSKLMGPQGRSDLLTLLRECEETDGGMLYEPRSTTEIGYRTGESLYSQTPVTIPYQDNLLLPFEPVEDDRDTRNRVTVTRTGGASATVQEATGPLGTTAVGVYDDDVTLSLATDEDAASQAAWRVHVGTHDEARWPTIGLNLAHPVFLTNTGLRDAVLGGLGLGNRIDVTDIPPWLPPFTVSQIIRNYREVITPLSYRLDFECFPARPYRVPEWNATTDRYSGEGTTTPALTPTQTTFTVTLPTGVTWTSADGPYPILVNGEVMRVTSVTGGNAFTVVRSVNGVVKSHAAGSPVSLADPVYYGY